MSIIVADIPRTLALSHPLLCLCLHRHYHLISSTTTWVQLDTGPSITADEEYKSKSTIPAGRLLPLFVPDNPNGPHTPRSSNRDGQRLVALDTSGGPDKLRVVHTLGFTTMDRLLSSAFAQELDG